MRKGGAVRASWIPGSALAVALAWPVHAADWLDSAEAAQFRDRVVLLALIYGESSGVDPQGFVVRTRELKKLDANCGEVEVVTLEADKEVRREQVRACRHG
jgi:hypothetical protein